MSCTCRPSAECPEHLGILVPPAEEQKPEAIVDRDPDDGVEFPWDERLGPPRRRDGRAVSSPRTNERSKRLDRYTALPGGRLSFNYVRAYYGVPAKRGGRVIFDGKPGRLTSGNGHYVRVLLDGETRPIIVHPTWRMEYLDV